MSYLYGFRFKALALRLPVSSDMQGKGNVVGTSQHLLGAKGRTCLLDLCRPGSQHDGQLLHNKKAWHNSIFP